MFGFNFPRNHRQDANSAFAADEQLKNIVLVAREQIQGTVTQPMNVPDALDVLRRFMRVENKADGTMTYYECEYHDCAFGVYMDSDRKMWFIRADDMMREPISLYDAASGLRLLAWIWDFRNTPVDQRNLCSRGYTSWDPDKQLEPGERYR